MQGVTEKSLRVSFDDGKRERVRCVVREAWCGG